MEDPAYITALRRRLLAGERVADVAAILHEILASCGDIAVLRHRERGGDQLTVWETFKVYDGQIHAVEAFMRILPIEKRNGGPVKPSARWLGAVARANGFPFSRDH